MRWLGVDAMMRELEQEAAEIPDPWAMVADAMRDELERREEQRREAERHGPGPLGGLSIDAALVVIYLHHLEHGRTFVARLRRRVPAKIDVMAALEELFELDLLKVEMAVDEAGRPSEPIVELRLDVELPEPPRPEVE